MLSKSTTVNKTGATSLGSLFLLTLEYKDDAFNVCIVIAAKKNISGLVYL